MTREQRQAAVAALRRRQRFEAEAARRRVLEENGQGDSQRVRSVLHSAFRMEPKP